MSGSLISVVVPVYNAEQYIDKCMDTLVNQSYKNIEIILVDDGSTDSSGQICDDYCSRYSFISVIHKENAGLGYARNTALEVIKGDYVCFVDPDDWVSCDYVKNLYTGLTSTGVDVCKGGFLRVTESGKTISIVQHPNEVYRENEARELLVPRMIGSAPDKHDSIYVSVCGALYSTIVIRDHRIRFPSEREMISEDLVFNIDFMQYASGACTVDTLDYFYRLNDASLSNRYRADRFEASTFFFVEMKRKLKELGYDDATLQRLKRNYFIMLRVSLRQEGKAHSQHDRKTSLLNIKKICDNAVVRDAINSYPVKRTGLKQRVFLNLVLNRNVGLLYFLANVGVL